MVFLEWIEAIGSSALLVIYFFYIAPIIDMLVVILTNLGSPAAYSFWCIKILQWTFIIFMVGVIIKPFLSTYRQTYDQGQVR